jgi:small GTP-binding protein
MSEVFEAFNSRRDEVIRGLSELERHAERVGARTLGTRIGRDVVGKLREDRFHLVVVGEFNHGKTTFVNALLGTSALPVGVTPTTALIHHVRFSEQPSARVVRTDGKHDDIPFGELNRLVVQGEARDGEDERVRFVEVGYPAELLRERIVLVDTPGVNDLCLQRADITYKYIPQSDAVLFVVDAGQPLKESERVFLRDKLIGQSRDKIIFVVAKSDIWSESEKSEALDYIRKELAKLVEGPVVFPISAQRALQGDLEGSGVGALVRHLTAFLAEERGRILLANALGEGLEAARSLGHSIEARRRTATMTADEIERRIARIEIDLEGQQHTVDERRSAIREETAAIRAWMRRDLDRFCDDVVRQLPEIVERSTVDELRMHLGGFLEATFVRWAAEEADEVARALEELSEKTVALMREDAHDAAKRLGEGASADVTPPDVHVDTFGYDVGVAALLSVGLGMIFTNALLGALMAGAAPVLAYYLKGRVELQTKAKAREQAALALREAASKVAPKLDEMITSFADRLEAWVVTAGKEVHQELIDVLKTARVERADTAPDVERVGRECRELEAELAGIRKHLEELRARLWSSDDHEPAAERPAAVSDLN